MGFSRKLVTFLSLSTAVAWAAEDPATSGEAYKNDAFIPFVKNRYIVEVESISQSAFARRGESLHKRLYDDLKTRAVDFEINKEFNNPSLFVGVSLTLKNEDDASKLQNIEGVKAIRPVHYVKGPKPVTSRGIKSASDIAPKDKQSTHVLTGVDRLHDEGRTGKGVKIGIIDTGIDYRHPVLGGGFGPGFKVAGGYDFVGDDYTGTSSVPNPDNDPLDCNGHGTHVAGIIGADPYSNPYNLSGVAYDASLTSYKVFGCYGGVTDDIILEAMLRAVEDNQDIISLSLGGTDGWTESTSAVLASRIAESGKVVTIAAGNEGTNGAWFTSSPGNGLGVISVASSDNIAMTVNAAHVEGAQHDPIPYKSYRVVPFPINGSVPIYVTSNSTNAKRDACSGLPDNTPDLTGHVAIVAAGGCTPGDKAESVQAKGAAAMLMYEEPGVFDETWMYGDYPQAGIRYEDGVWLVKQWLAGVPVKLTFPPVGGSVDLPEPDGGLISYFSTYGPTNDMYFKPALTAPGGNILSTYPIEYGYDYEYMSGTSMATPFVAGSAALLLEAKGKTPEVARNVQALLQTNSVGIKSTHDSTSVLQTLTQQGAGLINVYKAIHSTTVVSPSEMLLNDTAHFKGEHDFTVQNTGSTEQKYTISHIPAGTAQTVQPGKIQVALGPVPLTNDFASISFSESTITIAAGQSKTIKATFTPPKDDKTTYPVYSGFIQVTSDVDSLHISYMGLAASLKDKVVLDTTTEVVSPQLPYITYGSFFPVIQDGPKNYTFAIYDYPSLRMRLAFGTPVLRLDWVDARTTLSKREEPEGPSFTFPKKIAAAPMEIVGPFMEVDWLTRNSEFVDVSSIEANQFIINQAVFANGTQVPNGSYRILIRALRVTGDPNNAADYDMALSPVIGVYRSQ